MRQASGRHAPWRRGRDLLKHHLHILLYTYFWFGLFVCGLLAPPQRVEALGSGLVSRGWQLSLLSVFLVLPVPLIYALRMRAGRPRRNPAAPAAAGRREDP